MSPKDPTTTPTGKRPRITWAELLLSAPYFSSALADAVDEDEIKLTKLAPWPKAWLYWDVLDGEVSNGGVTQYFYNQADSLPGFAHAPEHIAAHPVLAPYAHFAREIHAVWAELAPDVREARSLDDLPSALFQRYAARFEALETAFYAISHTVRRLMEQHLLAYVHDYFDIAPLDEPVPAQGVAWLKCRGRGYRARLRFVDGFPVGPNVFERGKDGACDVVSFTASRTLLQVDHSGKGASAPGHTWLHYPSGASGRLRFNDGRLQLQETQRELWYEHGLRETYRDDGKIESTVLALDHDVFLRQHFHANGQRLLRETPQGQDTVETRWWPNGQLNTETTERDGNTRCLRCLDEAGHDLAPGGTGRFVQTLGDGRRREGALKNGLLEGEVIWTDADGKETGRAHFRGGRER